MRSAFLYHDERGSWAALGALVDVLDEERSPRPSFELDAPVLLRHLRARGAPPPGVPPALGCYQSEAMLHPMTSMLRGHSSTGQMRTYGPEGVVIELGALTPPTAPAPPPPPASGGLVSFNASEARAVLHVLEADEWLTAR
eukprot:6127780-Prymnesium_polylepis.1